MLGAVLQSSLVANVKSCLAAAPMPEAVKAEIINAVSSGGMHSMRGMGDGALSPEMSQAVFGAFASAPGSPMEMAMFICIGGAVVALLISYHPAQHRLSGQ